MYRYQVYSRDIADALPADVPHADAVRETLGGATAVAAQLPAGTADTVLAAARDAFTHGMGLAAVGAAGVMAGAGLFSLVVLGGAGKAKRPTKPAAEPKPGALV
ncbi:hypothetical protein ACFYWY_33245 [Streptomyces sp. NPDC002870]|uniref:hypothetical protein n=1 Tax=Streptomyces sp. NPDC002870 TaxID=3364666 RepID=UPI0036775C1F